MLNEDSGSLQCDLAETYHIYDMRAFPLRTVAVFSYGLGEDSRIMKKLTGVSASTQNLLLAQIADALNMMLWAQSEPGTPKPESMLSYLIPESDDERNEEGEAGSAETFGSPEDFEQARRRLIGGD